MTERTMTPEEAAALLEVPVDAELEQVERAFRYQAQRHQAEHRRREQDHRHERPE
jgi:hypothetical protein